MAYADDKCVSEESTLTLGTGKDKQDNPKDIGAITGTWSHLVKTKINQN